MTKICLKCNKEYDESATFCEKCGAELSEQNTEEKGVTNIFNRVIDKRNAHNEEKMKKYAEKRKNNEDKKIAKKMANRTATEKEYGFFYDDIAEIYKEDAKKADKVYKAYVTSGISRIEKVNGRFLASQLIKLDVINQQNNIIIQQNYEIIELLKEIANK